MGVWGREGHTSRRRGARQMGLRATARGVAVADGLGAWGFEGVAEIDWVSMGGMMRSKNGLEIPYRRRLPKESGPSICERCADTKANGDVAWLEEVVGHVCGVGYGYVVFESCWSRSNGVKKDQRCVHASIRVVK